MKLIVSVIAAVVCWQVGAAVEWKNLDKEHHLGGRVTSEGYMRGKVTLVCRWGLKFQKNSVGTHPAKCHAVFTFEGTVHCWNSVTFVGGRREYEEFSG